MTPHVGVFSLTPTIAALVLLVTLALLSRPSLAGGPGPVRLDATEAERLGRLIWRNETGGRMDRLLWWNRGEDFASLGIGHFIWYPRHYQGPFEETFPALVTFLRHEGVRLPHWLDKAPVPPCPWPHRDAFRGATHDERRLDLERLLRDTLGEQSRFLVRRLERAVPLLLAAVPAAERPQIEDRINALLATPAGRYALVDYVNFKGEGLKPSERYRGEGWGLLQVLQAMTGDGPPVADFAAAADRVLTRRVANADPSRREERWLAGWRARLETYTGGHD